MNKHIVKYLLALATIAFVGGGCNVDDYNEEYLDGFNPDKEITDVQVLKYTMTDADYASVASNAANKAIAEAAGPDAVAALARRRHCKMFLRSRFRHDVPARLPGCRLRQLPLERLDCHRYL